MSRFGAQCGLLWYLYRVDLQPTQVKTDKLFSEDQQ
jgi:hypothetical protein